MNKVYIETLEAEIARLYRMHPARANEITEILEKAAKNAGK